MTSGLLQSRVKGGDTGNKEGDRKGRLYYERVRQTAS